MAVSYLHIFHKNVTFTRCTRYIDSKRDGFVQASKKPKKQKTYTTHTERQAEIQTDTLQTHMYKDR